VTPPRNFKESGADAIERTQGQSREWSRDQQTRNRRTNRRKGRDLIEGKEKVQATNLKEIKRSTRSEN